MKLVLVNILFYLIGSIPFSLYVGKFFKGIDVRGRGSKNIGATNVARLCGTRCGLLALVLDLAKGGLVAFLAISWGIPIILSGLAVVGHNWSPWLKFSGGKGVATSLGILGVLSWPGFLIALAIWIGLAYLVSYASVSSMGALITSPLIIYLFGAQWEAVTLMLLLALLTIWQHRKNIGRLLKGEENKLSLS